MTLTATASVPGAATARPGPSPAPEPASGGYAFRDVLDGRDEPPAKTGKAPDDAGKSRSRDAAADSTEDEPGKLHARRDAGGTGTKEEEDEEPLCGRLPLLVNLHRLSGRTQDAKPDAAIAGDNANAGDGSTRMPLAVAAAAVVSASRDAAAGTANATEGQAGTLSSAGSASRDIPRGATMETGAAPAPAQAADAAARALAHGQPATPGKPMPGTVIDGTAETDAATGSSAEKTAGPDAASLHPDRLRVPAPGQKGGNDDAPQQRSGERRRDDTPHVTIAASQSFATPASRSMSPTTTMLVATIAADNGFRQVVSMLPAAVLGAVSTHILKIELHPADLGSVTAHLRMTGEQLSVELRPETHEAYRRLEADKDDIARSLKKLGLGVDSVTVLQPQMASTPAARTDLTSSATAAPHRDPTSFQSGDQSGGGAGTAGQQSGRQPERNSNDGRHDGARNAQASRIGAGGNLFI